LTKIDPPACDPPCTLYVTEDVVAGLSRNVRDAFCCHEASVSDRNAEVVRGLLDAVSPTAIAVLSLIRRKTPMYCPEDEDITTEATTSILLVALVGVMDTLNPVMSVKVPPVADVKVSVFVVLTT
jgi:hypothetical protein